MRNNRKNLFLCAAAAAVLVTGCGRLDRVYLMVHYATDVLGGMIIGTLSGIAGYYIMKGLMYLIANVKPFTALDKLDLAKIKFLKWTSGRAGAAVVALLRGWPVSSWKRAPKAATKAAWLTS